MQFSNHKNTTRWVLIAASFVIITLILWNTYTFFQIFKDEERVKMEHWAEAQKTLNNAGVDTDIELPLKIIRNARIPIILTENNKILSTKNIEDGIVNDNSKSVEMLAKLKNQNDPIAIEYVPGKFQYLYYGDSSLLNKLKYYPIALILIIVLSNVKIKNQANGLEMKYTLVAESEADLKTGKISVTSPIGRGLLGKSVGDLAEITVPNGVLKFQVLEISRD